MVDQTIESRQDWEHFPHDADIGVRGFGDTPAEAFANAARALTAIVVPLDTVAADRTIDVECATPDLEVLFVDWLNAVIFEMATRHMLFRDFKVDIVDGVLKGQAIGEPVDVERHRPAVEPKGATFTALNVGRDPDGRWIAQCIVDV